MDEIQLDKIPFRWLEEKAAQYGDKKKRLQMEVEVLVKDNGAKYRSKRWVDIPVVQGDMTSKVYLTEGIKESIGKKLSAQSQREDDAAECYGGKKERLQAEVEVAKESSKQKLSILMEESKDAEESTEGNG